MPIIVSFLAGSSQPAPPVEIVERKGLGHPDTLCDALAEAASTTLCRYYREHFGLILHHNLDKALLLGGVSIPAFNGGYIEKPMDIFFAGRATHEFKGKKAPIEELIIETGRQWLKQHMHALNVDHHIRLHCRVRPGSRELVDLYLRQRSSGVALANDTSCGVGYAPPSELEQLVLTIEQQLNAPNMKMIHPEIGEDIKVMAVRIHDEIIITIGCAFVDRHIANMNDYQTKKAHVVSIIKDLISQHTGKAVSIAINTADGKTPESIYLTVTGTSAEAGDDGEVGRGNRTNGLITPYRPMNMEAAAGKNPVTHVGKLYNITAQRIAASIVEEIEIAQQAQCYLVSRIGNPITHPQVVDVKVTLPDATPPPQLDASIIDIVNHHLTTISKIQDDVISGSIRIF